MVMHKQFCWNWIIIPFMEYTTKADTTTTLHKETIFSADFKRKLGSTSKVFREVDSCKGTNRKRIILIFISLNYTVQRI